MIDTLPDDLESVETKWAIRAGDPDVDLYQSLSLAKGTFLAANLKAQHYYTICDLYFTPAKLHRWGKREDDKCPRCDQGPADIIHMFYVCEKLGPLKKQIEEFLSAAIGSIINITPTLMLLGCDEKAQYDYHKNKFVFISIAVTRLLIATHWKDADPPLYHAWLGRLLAIYHVEKSLYKCKGHDASRRGREIWAPLKK